MRNDKGLIARTVGRLALDIARMETRAALEDNAALAAYPGSSQRLFKVVR